MSKAQLLIFHFCGASFCSTSAASLSRICRWSGKHEAKLLIEVEFAPMGPLPMFIRAATLRRVMQVHPVAKQQDGGQILTDFPDVFDKLVKRNR